MDRFLVEEEPPDSLGVRLARDQLAFLLASAASVASGAYVLLVAGRLLFPTPDLRRLVDDPRWDVYFGGPMLVANLLAAILLVGGDRTTRGWRARAWVLAMSCVASLIYWWADHASMFGRGGPILRAAADPIQVFSLRLIVLIRLVTLSELAGWAADDPDRRDFEPLRRLAIGAASLAFALWLLFAITQVRWEWPLRWRNFLDPQTYLLMLGSTVVRGASSFLVAILCAHASAASRRRRLAAST